MRKSEVRKWPEMEPAAENTISERLLSPSGSGSDPSYCCGSIPDMACGKAENGESSLCGSDR